MNKFISYVAMFSLTFSLSLSPVLAVDHSTSDKVGEQADQAGEMFVEGASKVAEVFVVKTKIVVGGVSYVVLKGMQGTVWIAEEAFAGAKYLVEGAKVIIIKTAQGIRWVAVKAMEAAEIVIEGLKDAGKIIVDGVVFIAVKVEAGVRYVAESLVKAGQFIVDGVTYVAVKTKEGVIWVAKNTAAAVKATYQWSREQVIRVRIRTRLATAMVGGSVSADTLSFFKSQSESTASSASLQRLALAAYNAAAAFSQAYAR